MCTHDVRNLAEWLVLEVLRRFRLALEQIDHDELEGDFLLVQDHRDALGAGRLGPTVELEDHDD